MTEVFVFLIVSMAICALFTFVLPAIQQREKNKGSGKILKPFAPHVRAFGQRQAAI